MITPPQKKNKKWRSILFIVSATSFKTSMTLQTIMAVTASFSLLDFELLCQFDKKKGLKVFAVLKFKVVHSVNWLHPMLERPTYVYLLNNDIVFNI